MTDSALEETNDAEKVDAAVALLNRQKSAEAARILTDVISRAPANYVREIDAQESLQIKFWDLEEFSHFVSDPRNHKNRSVVWLPSAYPRAFYYMGFTLVRLGQPAAAVTALEAGMRLEPHPLLFIERGKALAELKQFDDAIASYQAAFDMGDAINARLRALALRGKGFVLIEKGELDMAETAFEASLKLEPGNPVAGNELSYIAQLRRGGRKVPTQRVTTAAPLECAICGEKNLDGGKISTIDGRVVWRCRACAAKLPATGGTPGLPSVASAIGINVIERKKPRRPWWKWWA